MLLLALALALFKLLTMQVFASTIIADSGIVQVVPPKAKFGTNHDAFDKTSGLNI